MWPRGVIAVTMLACLAPQTSLRGQECDPNYYGRVPFYLSQPYTAEYRERYESGDHQDPPREDIRVEARDSQGRRLDSWASAGGTSRSQVRDPVAGETITWNASSTKAKVVQDPTPVAGRSSCWQTPDPERQNSPEEPPIGMYKSSCAPAGEGQALFCNDACEAKRRAKALPALKNGFPPCDSEEPGTEDLGTKVIHGVAAHGCRTTKTLPNGSWKCSGRCPAPSPHGSKTLEEIWSDDYGLTVRKIEVSRHGDKYSEELTSLNRDEPDLSIFRPPEGYDVVTLEMHEVPCNQPN
jgi:hypothetical protein